MTILRKALFGVLFATVLLVAGFLVTEVGLRLAGFGHSPDFWRKTKDAKGQTVLRENGWVTAPFFAPELVRKPQPFLLPEKKAPQTYRIFVLGSSAAMGDPDASFSMARVLETMLRAAYPEIHFEVINAGVTAINSHVVRSIAVDCAALKPDLFVVYEGNNEVIGPFGPGTVFTTTLQHPSAVRAAVFFRELRVGQWLTQAVARSLKRGDTPADWGGMEMFLQHKIARTDPRLNATQRLFASNLQAIARVGRRAGATVLLSTVLTNQKDFAPFQSEHRRSLDETELRQWSAEMQAGDAAVKADKWAEAEGHFRNAVEIDPLYAEDHYQLGRALLRQNKTSEAKVAFQEAVDLDLLRFRTDSRLNETIRSVAAQAGAGVRLVDAARAAEAESAGGVLGDEMLYEHVHLTFRGTYIVARELFKEVAADLRSRAFTNKAEPAPLALDDVRAKLAFTTYEQALIAKEMIARLRRAPFTQQSNNAERLSAYQQRDARAAQLLALPESKQAINAIYEKAIENNPSDWVLRRNYGMNLVAAREPAAAKAQLRIALETIPDDADTVYALSLAHRALGEKDEEARRLAQLEGLDPRYLRRETRRE